MAKNLKYLLDSIHTKENKLTFLKNIYTPGDTKVADAILKRDPTNYNVIHGEIKVTDGAGSRFESIARKYVDKYTAKDATSAWHISETEKVISWGNKKIAKYALSKIKQNAGKFPTSLEHAADLAEAFCLEKEREEYLEAYLGF